MSVLSVSDNLLHDAYTRAYIIFQKGISDFEIVHKTY